MPYNTLVIFAAYDQLPAADLNANFANLDYLLARVAPRTLTIASDATPTINTDAYDFVDITGLATNITSMTTNLSGTPTNFQPLIIMIKDNGVAKTIAWGTSFESVGATLPTATIANKRLVIGLRYNSTSGKWMCWAVDLEA